MKIYDVCIPVHETEEGIPPICELIEKLGEMLDQYNIGYSIVLPHAAAVEKDEKLCYWLYYQSEQNTELTLVVSLFGSLYLKKPKQKILETIVKSFGREK